MPIKTNDRYQAILSFFQFKDINNRLINRFIETKLTKIFTVKDSRERHLARNNGNRFYRRENVERQIIKYRLSNFFFKLLSFPSIFATFP